jgi:hypothetical protein
MTEVKQEAENVPATEIKPVEEKKVDTSFRVE